MRRFATILACAGALVAAAPANAEVRELGSSANAPFVDPSCPTDCQAIGRVTGFPVQIGSVKNPMSVTDHGYVVAFTIRLGKPDAQQTTFFEGLFGGPSQVRLSILKPQRKRIHKLIYQSDVFNVTNYFGSTPTFVLKQPLRINFPAVVALTVPTWVPAFAVNQPSTTAWRFSRQNCDNAQEAAAQQTIRSLQPYTCFKTTARPIYSVTFIPDPKPTNTSTTGSGTTSGNTSGTSTGTGGSGR
jgi:hypothetical protein